MISNTIAVAVIFLSQIVWANTGVNKQQLQQITNKSIELYNKQQYVQALSALEQIKSSRQQYVNWYYYHGLNHMRLRNYDQALASFESYVRGANITDTARAYYYMGLIQFNQGNYDKAINSLELSMDVSQDPKLDQLTETLIDRTIRHQNYYENSKKANIALIVGYTYDSNVLNLSQDQFAEKLNGHVFNYGGSFSYKVVDKYSFVFEPTLAILDSYSLDSGFKANSTIQSSDALQGLLSLPLRFYDGEGVLAKRYDMSLNIYQVHLPLTTSKRELALSSFFLRGQIFTPFSSRYNMRYNAVIAADKSHGHSTDDDDASGLRLEFLATFTQYLSDRGINNVFYDLGAENNGAKGVNARYQRYIAGVGYMFPTFGSTTSAVRLGYVHMAYPDRAPARRDNQVNFSYNMMKELQSLNASVGFNLGAVSNSSNSDLNKYSDYSAGLLYTQNISF